MIWLGDQTLVENESLLRKVVIAALYFISQTLFVCVFKPIMCSVPGKN